MNNDIVLNILRFLGLMALQVLFVNNINLFGLVTPSVFVLFILLLPHAIKPSGLMLIAMFTGFTQDLFQGTLGLNMFCAVFLAFSRPYILSIITDKKMDDEFKISLQEQGFRWTVLYLILSFFLYHMVYFTVEIWNFQNILYIIFKSVYSGLFSVVFSLILLYTFYKGKDRKY